MSILLVGLFLIASLMISSCGSTDQPMKPTTESAVAPDQPTTVPTIEPTTPPDQPSPTAQSQAPAVPQKLVGRWNGGSNAAPEGHWYYTFYSNGQYQMYNAQKGTYSGTFIVNGSQITFSNGGSPLTVTWSITYDELLGDVLFLDGYSWGLPTVGTESWNRNLAQETYASLRKN